MSEKAAVGGQLKTHQLGTHIKRYWFIYMLVLPGFLHNILFRYVPMYGILTAFQDYKISKGVFGSPFVGLKYFKTIFGDEKILHVIFNTVLINTYIIIYGTIFVIILSLFINEIRFTKLKRIIQTSVYLPNFLSWVVFAGLIMVILSPTDGPIGKIAIAMGSEPVYYILKKEYFRSIVVITAILKTAGFSTVVYMAAISGINPELYECAVLDGANRAHLAWYVTIPRIKPTIAVLLILSISQLFISNFEQIFNLYNPLVYDTGDVLSTYVYRSGLQEGKFEMATALGLLFNFFGFIAVIITNKVINKMNVTGIF